MFAHIYHTHTRPIANLVYAFNSARAQPSELDANLDEADTVFANVNCAENDEATTSKLA